jgi:hypothetical protein
MEKEIEVEGNRIFLKGKNDSWRIIHPIKVDGKIVWKNLIAGGNWWNLVIVAVVVIILLGAINEYASNLKLTSACLRALPDSTNLNMFIDNPTLNYSYIFP